MRSFGNVLAAALAAALFSTAAWAGENHKGGHYTFGEPGVESEVTRTVEVTATDDMRLLMDVPSIRQGETIKFVVINRGEIPHEFSVGDTGSQRAHANLMKRNPDMTHHDDPAAVTLEPGETRTIIWRFSKPIQGDVVFACQMPGHWDAGMLYKAKFERGSKPVPTT
jgi:uncharacterized cupredoxin-like copper-binding protein